MAPNVAFSRRASVRSLMARAAEAGRYVETWAEVLALKRFDCISPITALLLGLLLSNSFAAECNSSKSKWDHLPKASEVLGEPNDDLRLENVVCLDSFGAEAVPILTKAISDKRRDIRLVAIYTLTRLGPKAKKSLSALIKAFDNPDETTRQLVIDGIYGVDPKGEQIKKTLPLYRKAFHDPDKETRRRAKQNFENMGILTPKLAKESGFYEK